MARVRNANEPWLYDEVTGNIVGIKQPDGTELLFSSLGGGGGGGGGDPPEPPELDHVYIQPSGGDDTTAINAVASGSDGISFKARATYNVGKIIISPYQHINGNKATLKWNGGAATLGEAVVSQSDGANLFGSVFLNIPSGMVVRDLIIDGNDVNLQFGVGSAPLNITGFVGSPSQVSSYSTISTHARLLLENVITYQCKIGMDMRSVQFESFRSIGALDCEVGIMLRSNWSGGGNSDGVIDRPLVSYNRGVGFLFSNEGDAITYGLPAQKYIIAPILQNNRICALAMVNINPGSSDDYIWLDGCSTENNADNASAGRHFTYSYNYEGLKYRYQYTDPRWTSGQQFNIVGFSQQVVPGFGSQCVMTINSIGPTPGSNTTVFNMTRAKLTGLTGANELNNKIWSLTSLAAPAGPTTSYMVRTLHNEPVDYTTMTPYVSGGLAVAAPLFADPDWPVITKDIPKTVYYVEAGNLNFKDMLIGDAFCDRVITLGGPTSRVTVQNVIGYGNSAGYFCKSLDPDAELRLRGTAHTIGVAEGVVEYPDGYVRQVNYGTGDTTQLLLCGAPITMYDASFPSALHVDVSRDTPGFVPGPNSTGITMSTGTMNLPGNATQPCTIINFPESHTGGQTELYQSLGEGTSETFNIVNVEATNPCRITVNSTGIVGGLNTSDLALKQAMFITGTGVAGLNGAYNVVRVPGDAPGATTRYHLFNVANQPIDGTGFTGYTGAGTARVSAQWHQEYNMHFNPNAAGAQCAISPYMLSGNPIANGWPQTGIKYWNWQAMLLVDNQTEYAATYVNANTFTVAGNMVPVFWEGLEVFGYQQPSPNSIFPVQANGWGEVRGVVRYATYNGGSNTTTVVLKMRQNYMAGVPYRLEDTLTTVAYPIQLGVSVGGSLTYPPTIWPRRPRRLTSLHHGFSVYDIQWVLYCATMFVPAKIGVTRPAFWMGQNKDRWQGNLMCKHGLWR